MTGTSPVPASHADLLERPLHGHLEVRGVVEGVEADPDGAFFDVLARRYGLPHDPPVGDAPHRVVLRVRPTAVSSQ